MAGASGSAPPVMGAGAGAGSAAGSGAGRAERAGAQRLVQARRARAGRAGSGAGARAGAAGAGGGRRRGWLAGWAEAAAAVPAESGRTTIAVPSRCSIQRRPPRALDAERRPRHARPHADRERRRVLPVADRPRLPAKTSTDLMRWQGAAARSARQPGWIAREVPGATDLWAPDVSFFGGQYHLYYSASTFGSNSSCIGHATRDALASGSWSDQGSVICSNHGSNDNWNAIDPNVVVDARARRGCRSAASGAASRPCELDANGARADDELHALAGAPTPAARSRRRSSCAAAATTTCSCRSTTAATASTARTTSASAARENVLGPYVDKSGTRDAATAAARCWSWATRAGTAPATTPSLFSGDRAYNVYHAYDANRTAPPASASPSSPGTPKAGRSPAGREKGTVLHNCFKDANRSRLATKNPCLFNTPQYGMQLSRTVPFLPPAEQQEEEG